MCTAGLLGAVHTGVLRRGWGGMQHRHACLPHEQQQQWQQQQSHQSLLRTCCGNVAITRAGSTETVADCSLLVFILDLIPCPDSAPAPATASNRHPDVACRNIKARLFADEIAINDSQTCIVTSQRLLTRQPIPLLHAHCRCRPVGIVSSNVSVKNVSSVAFSTQRSPHRTGADSAVCCKHLYLRGNGLWQRGALSPCSHLLRHLNRPNHSSQSVCQCWMRHHRWIVTGHSRSLPDCNRYNECRRFH